jgi:hypothetical protein
MRFVVNGQAVEVRRGGAASCENYLYVWVAGQEFFLMVAVPGLRKRDVRDALSRHPQLRQGTASSAE